MAAVIELIPVSDREYDYESSEVKSGFLAWLLSLPRRAKRAVTKLLNMVLDLVEFRMVPWLKRHPIISSGIAVGLAFTCYFGWIAGLILGAAWVEVHLGILASLAFDVIYFTVSYMAVMAIIRGVFN